MPEHGKCGVCGRKYRINTDGTLRSHWARTPDGKAAPGLPDCDGAGKPPVRDAA